MTTKISELQALTPELLERFEQADMGDCLIIDNYNTKYIGRYEWHQGRNPHGFETNGGRVYADDVKFVAFFTEE